MKRKSENPAERELLIRNGIYSATVKIFSSFSGPRGIDSVAVHLKYKRIYFLENFCCWFPCNA